MRTRSSSKRFKAFEFSEAEERIEKASKQMLGKFRNPKSDHSPVAKYKFLQSFAQGTKTGKKILNEIVDVDGSNDPVKERTFELETTAPSGSSNHKPTNSPDYLDSGHCFSGLNTCEARALNHGVTSTSGRHSDTILPQLLFDNEPVTINSDDDDRIELISSTSNVDLTENKGSLKQQALEHCFGGCVIDTVVIFADYIIYGDRYCANCRLTFSCHCIKVEGLAKRPFSFEWTVGDIINIESQWCKEVEAAAVNIHLKLEDAKVENTNASSEVKFAVSDPNWPEIQEAIKSLDVRYKANWNTISVNDIARNEDSCLGNNLLYSTNPAESFEEVTYPNGDPDAVSISKRDIELLQPETFINDTVIDFYIQYLKNKIKPEEKHRFHFFNSFFFRKLADLLDRDPSRACESRAAFQRIRKWTRKVNLFEKDYIFIPVNLSLHWSLIVICHPGDVADFEVDDMEKLSKVPCILHMDSIRGSHRGFKNLIQRYLWEEWKERENQPLKDVSPKFMNLQFVPLELPQQENSFDCGLFLLHYLELFLDRAPVEFSPFRITSFSNFLSKDWFPPAEASLKRAHIKKLMHGIFEDYSQKVTPAPFNDDKYPPELPGRDEGATSINFLQERDNSTEICSSSYSSSIDDQKIEIRSLTETPPRGVRRSKEQDSAFRELLERRVARGLLSDRSCQVVGQMVSLDQSRKNVMSPIEAGEENHKQFDNSSTHKAGGQQPTELLNEPSTRPYSAKPIRMLAPSSPPVIHLEEEDDDDDDDDGDSSPETSIGRSPISSEVGVNEGHQPLGFWDSNSAGNQEKSESPSTSSEGIAVCIVEDSQEEDEADDVKEIERSLFRLGKFNGSLNQVAERTEIVVVQASDIPSISELEEQVAAKRPRLMPPEGGR